MSWHCSLALLEEFSARGFLDGERSEQLRSIRIAEKSCFGGKKKDTSKRSLSSVTYDDSTAERGVERWISSLRDSRVSRSQRPGAAYRMERIRATGNVQVPGVVRTAWELLSKDTRR